MMVLKEHLALANSSLVPGTDCMSVVANVWTHSRMTLW